MAEERNLFDLEAEKQETREFIELFQAMPREKRRDVKYIMIGVNLMSQEQEDKYTLRNCNRNIREGKALT